MSFSNCRFGIVNARHVNGRGSELSKAMARPRFRGDGYGRVSVSGERQILVEGEDVAAKDRSPTGKRQLRLLGTARRGGK